MKIWMRLKVILILMVWVGSEHKVYVHVAEEG